MPPDNIPDWLRDNVMTTKIAMENLSKHIEAQNQQWPQLISALNNDFAVHNNRTEELCKAIAASTAEGMTFRTVVFRTQEDMIQRMWKLFAKVVILTVGLLGGIAGGVELVKFLFPGVG